MVLQVAWPLLTGCAEQPEMPVPLAVNATVPPVGVGETVAVNVTELSGLVV
jgi:hypothetical protein